MKVLNNLGNSLKVTAIKAGAKISKRSPEILMVAGGITFVATVVVACKQTLKCEDILDKHERAMNDIQACQEMADEDPEKVQYSDQDAKKDKFIAYVHTVAGFAKVYAPAVALGAISITCFGCSFNIMKKRNLALTAAYTAIDSAFKEYRKRVVDELGEESDQHFRYGFQKVKKGLIAGKDADGNDISVKGENLDTVPWDEENKSGDGVLNNATFVFAPETSKYYFPDEVHNDASISAAKNNLQIDFDNQKFLFLNDALDALGLQKVPYGQLVGWLKGMGDPYIDFRTRKLYRKASSDRNRNPLGLEYECIYEFDFNTCGVIWDKI